MKFKDINEFYEALNSAFAEGNDEFIKRALKEGTLRVSLNTIVDKLFNTYRLNIFDRLLVIASYKGHLGLCRILFMKGALFDAPFDKWGHTAFTLAAKYGHLEICQQFLDDNAEYGLATDLTEPLIRACRNNHLDIIELFIAHGADPQVINESNVCFFRTRWEVLYCLYKNGTELSEDYQKMMFSEKNAAMKDAKKSLKKAHSTANNGSPGI